MNSHEFRDAYTSVSILDIFRLIEALISDIQHLEAEVVRTRYKLTRCLPAKERELMCSDILSILGGRHASNPAYDVFVREWFNGTDPMDSDEWVEHIWRLAHGEESDLW